MTQSPTGGPAQTTYQVTSRQGVIGRDAQRVVIVTDGRPQEGGPQQAAYFVSDAEIAAGDFIVTGNKPLPIVKVGASGAEYPPIAVYDVTGMDDDVQPAQTSISDDLRSVALAYWTMNESSGTRIDSKSNNDLTLLNNDASDTGKIGNALKINDFDGYAGRAVTNLNLYPNSWSISFWIYFDTLNIIQSDLPFAGKYDTDQDNWEWGFYQDHTLENPEGGRISFFSFSNALSISNNIFEGTWHFIVFEYDTDLEKLKIYVDGVFNNETNILVGDINVMNGPFYIGAGDGYVTGTHKFRMDEVFIRTGIFTQEQIDYLYNSGAGRALFPAP